MKISGGIIGIVASFVMAHGGLAATEPSKLSAFAGRYNGSVVYGGALSGTTTATFSSSKKKDAGTLTLSSTINSFGTLEPLAETIRINKKTVSYSLLVSTSSGSGTGNVHVGKKVITYNASFSVGGFIYSITGTIRKSGKRRMTVSETISGNVNFPINYSLTRKGK